LVKGSKCALVSIEVLDFDCRDCLQVLKSCRLVAGFLSSLKSDHSATNQDADDRNSEKHDHGDQ